MDFRFVIALALCLLGGEALLALRTVVRLKQTRHGLGWLASCLAGGGLLFALWAGLTSAADVWLWTGLLVALIGHTGDLACRLLKISRS